MSVAGGAAGAVFDGGDPVALGLTAIAVTVGCLAILRFYVWRMGVSDDA